MRFGVVRFPGSLRRGRRAAGLPRASATPSCSGTATATCAASTPWSSPAASPTATTCAPGAIARFSPVMEAVAEFAARGRPGARHLQRLPGAVRGGPAARARCSPTTACASSAARWRSGGERRHAVHARVRARASGCRSRSSTPPAATTRRRTALDELEANGQVVLRYADGPEPQRLAARHRRRVQHASERHGPDAPPRARGRPAHRLGRRRPRCSRRSRRTWTSWSPRREHAPRRTASSASPTPSTSGIVRAARARAERAGARRVLADVVRALRLQALEEAAAHAAHRGAARGDGPGRERRRRGRGRRAGGRVQGRVAQPPERGRAVPGRGHRRRAGSCATCSRSARGRSRSSTRCASASSTPRARATCFDRAVAGIGHYGNSIGVATVGGEVAFEPSLRAQLPRERDVRGHRPPRAARSAAPPPGVGNRSCCSARSPGRDGIGGASVLASAELGEDDAAKRPERADRRPVRGEEAARVLPRAARRAGCSCALQDLGAAGLSSSAVGDGLEGRGGTRHRRVARAAARGRTWSPSRSWSRSRRSGCSAWWSPTRLAEVLEVCERWEVRATAIGEVTDTRRLRVLDGDELVGDMPVAALVDDCPLYDLEPEPPAEPVYPDPPAPARRGRARRETPARAARARPTSPPSAGPSSSTTRSSARARVRRPGGGRRRGAPARARRRQRRDRGLDRRQRPARGVRPLHRRGRGGARVRAQPRLRRRRAARPHQLPQLRQPREAAHRLAAHARRGGAAATPAARSACRSWAATSRSTTRARRGRSTRRRSWAWSARLPDPARRPGSASREEGHAIALVGPFAPGPRGLASSRSCAGGSRDGLPAVDLERAGRRRWRRCARPCARAGSRPAHDVSEGGLAVRARRVLHRRRDRRARGPGSTGAPDDRDAPCSARARAARVVAGPGRGGRRHRRARCVLGEVGGDAPADRGVGRRRRWRRCASASRARSRARLTPRWRDAVAVASPSREPRGQLSRTLLQA